MDVEKSPVAALPAAWFHFLFPDTLITSLILRLVRFDYKLMRLSKSGDKVGTLDLDTARVSHVLQPLLCRYHSQTHVLLVKVQQQWFSVIDLKFDWSSALTLLHYAAVSRAGA